MKNLTLTQKTGFSSLLPFKIFDVNGSLFYSDTFTDKIENGKRLFFNLPKGSYKYEGIIIKQPQPVKHKEIVLPKPQRNIENKNYRIIFKDNPNKCTIYYKLGLIVFDNALKKIPLFMKVNIYYHEMGHHLYKDEHLADLYAAKKMLEIGFNSSQIGLSNIINLSDKQEKRKQFLVNNLTN